MASHGRNDVEHVLLPEQVPSRVPRMLQRLQLAAAQVWASALAVLVQGGVAAAEARRTSFAERQPVAEVLRDIHNPSQAIAPTLFAGTRAKGDSAAYSWNRRDRDGQCMRAWRTVTLLWP
jgi:hypothetical protein